MFVTQAQKPDKQQQSADGNRRHSALAAGGGGRGQPCLLAGGRRIGASLGVRPSGPAASAPGAQAEQESISRLRGSPLFLVPQEGAESPLSGGLREPPWSWASLNEFVLLLENGVLHTISPWTYEGTPMPRSSIPRASRPKPPSAAPTRRQPVAKAHHTRSLSPTTFLSDPDNKGEDSYESQPPFRHHISLLLSFSSASSRSARPDSARR